MTVTQTMTILAETALALVAPLLFLYLKGTWPMRKVISCLMVIPVLWYLTYAPIHELSHAGATYLVGGKVAYIKLIPSFWHGEFAGAWITATGMTHPWQWLAMTAAPYLLDLASLAAGIGFLRRGFSKNPLIVGLAFMLLCLRPAFDLVCESVGWLSGFQGDLYHIGLNIGGGLTWSLLVLSMGLSLAAIIIVLGRFAEFPEAAPTTISKFAFE
jgi:hypothetical protein